MRRTALPLLVAALLGGAAVAPLHAQPAAAPTLTLPQAIERALVRSPAVAAALHEVRAAEAAHAQAGARANPELVASVEDTRRATRVTRATLGLPLDLAGARGARVAASQVAVDLAQAEWRRAQAEARAAVIAAYFATRVAQERAALARSSLALAERGADAVSRRVAAGRVSPVDETRARVDLANAQLEAAEAQAEFDRARGALALLWGDEAPDFADVAAELATAPTRPPVAELMVELEDAPALVVARHDIERRRALVDVERARGRPDVQLAVGAEHDNERRRTAAVVEVSLPLPFFDRNEGGVREALRRVDKADQELAALRLRLAGEVRQAASRLAIARASLQSLRDTVLPAAGRALDAATQGYEAGKFGVLDVIDAQRALLQARARYLATLSAAWQASADIDRLIGR